MCKHIAFTELSYYAKFQCANVFLGVTKHVKTEFTLQKYIQHLKILFERLTIWYSIFMLSRQFPSSK